MFSIFRDGGLRFSIFLWRMMTAQDIFPNGFVPIMLLFFEAGLQKTPHRRRESTWLTVVALERGGDTLKPEFT